MVLVATWRAASRWAEVSFVAPRSPAPRREGSVPPRPRMGNHPHVPWAQAWRRILKPRMQGSRDGVWWMGRRGGFARRGGHWAGESSRCEDPAPTVGRTLRPIPPPINDAARCVATFFEKWNCLIETYLRARRENLPRKIDPLRAFRRGSPFGIRRSKTYSPALRRT